MICRHILFLAFLNELEFTFFALNQMVLSVFTWYVYFYLLLIIKSENKKSEKIDNYLDLARELRKLWNMRVMGVYIFTKPSARAGYDTRSISKRSLTGLNSEFFFLLD